MILSILLALSLKNLLRREMEMSIKVIYFLTLTTAITYNVTSNISNILKMICLDSPQLSSYLEAIDVTAYYYMLTCVVSILLLRLYLTFQESIFELSKNQKVFLIIVFSLHWISSIVGTILYYTNNPMVILIIVSGLWKIIYLTESIYGMILFAQKMYALTKMRASSIDNDQVLFNEQQMELLRTTTKYVTLLSIAMISSWIYFFFVSINGILPGQKTSVSGPLLGTLGNIDCVINILCLYLQFPFNNEYYDKYCICFTKFCMYFLEIHAKRQVGKEHKPDIEKDEGPTSDQDSNGGTEIAVPSSQSIDNELQDEILATSDEIEELPRQQTNIILEQTLQEALRMKSIETNTKYTE